MAGDRVANALAKFNVMKKAYGDLIRLRQIRMTKEEFFQSLNILKSKMFEKTTNYN